MGNICGICSIENASQYKKESRPAFKFGDNSELIRVENKSGSVRYYTRSRRNSESNK